MYRIFRLLLILLVCRSEISGISAKKAKKNVALIKTDVESSVGREKSYGTSIEAKSNKIIKANIKNGRASSIVSSGYVPSSRKNENKVSKEIDKGPNEHHDSVYYFMPEELISQMPSEISSLTTRHPGHEYGGHESANGEDDRGRFDEIVEEDPYSNLACEDEESEDEDRSEKDYFISKRVLSCKRVKNVKQEPEITSGKLKGYTGKRKRSWVRCDIMRESRCTVVSDYRKKRPKKAEHGKGGHYDGINDVNNDDGRYESQRHGLDNDDDFHESHHHINRPHGEEPESRGYPAEANHESIDDQIPDDRPHSHTSDNHFAPQRINPHDQDEHGDDRIHNHHQSDDRNDKGSGSYSNGLVGDFFEDHKPDSHQQGGPHPRDGHRIENANDGRNNDGSHFFNDGKGGGHQSSYEDSYDRQYKYDDSKRGRYSAPPVKHEQDRYHPVDHFFDSHQKSQNGKGNHGQVDQKYQNDDLGRSKIYYTEEGDQGSSQGKRLRELDDEHHPYRPTYHTKKGSSKLQYPEDEEESGAYFNDHQHESSPSKQEKTKHDSNDESYARVNNGYEDESKNKYLPANLGQNHGKSAISDRGNVVNYERDSHGDDRNIRNPYQKRFPENLPEHQGPSHGNANDYGRNRQHEKFPVDDEYVDNRNQNDRGNRYLESDYGHGKHETANGHSDAFAGEGKYSPSNFDRTQRPLKGDRYAKSSENNGYAEEEGNKKFKNPPLVHFLPEDAKRDEFRSHPPRNLKESLRNLGTFRPLTEFEKKINNGNFVSKSRGTHKEFQSDYKYKYGRPKNEPRYQPKDSFGPPVNSFQKHPDSYNGRKHGKQNDVEFIEPEYTLKREQIRPINYRSDRDVAQDLNKREVAEIVLDSFHKYLKKNPISIPIHVVSNTN